MAVSRGWGAFSYVEGPLEHAGTILPSQALGPGVWPRHFAQALRPGDRGAAAGELVALHRLGRGHEGRVQRILVGDLAGLLDDAVDRRTGDGHGAVAGHLEDFLQAPALRLGLTETCLEALLQVRMRSLVDQLGQGLRGLIAGGVDILESVDKEVVERFDIADDRTLGCLHRSRRAGSRSRRRKLAPPARKRAPCRHGRGPHIRMTVTIPPTIRA